MMKNPDTSKCVCAPCAPLHLSTFPFPRFVEDVYGSPERAKREILVDFFRHGFDGSGSDNFFDAGSCIDGRLTSVSTPH